LTQRAPIEKLTKPQPDDYKKLVSPEMAAKVVREFILPMFESEGKKILRKKNPKSSSPRSVGVFQELKLS
jgi:hypothetical protein